MRESFPQCLRISTKRDIQLLKDSDRKLKGKYVVIIYRENGLDFARLLPVVSSKVGNAVMRNRIKRKIREVFRKRVKSLSGYDLMIIAKRLAAGAVYSELEIDILKTLEPIIDE
ncbi:MAG: ribonuclease P protein component [Myxococcota bacterium]